MLPLSVEALASELDSIKKLTDKWAAAMEKGVPGQDTYPDGMSDSQISFDTWLVELVGELRLLSGKTLNLSEVLVTRLTG